MQVDIYPETYIFSIEKIESVKKPNGITTYDYQFVLFKGNMKSRRYQLRRYAAH